MEIYRRVAPYYDDQSEANRRGNEVKRKVIYDLISKCGGAVVLDLGCGTGVYFDVLVGCERVVGIDMSEEMLLAARPRTKAKNIDLIRADIFNLPFQQDKARFDIVISTGVLGVHVPLTKGLLLNIRAVLKSPGWLLFTTNVMRRHWRAVIKRKLYELLRAKEFDSPLFRLLGWSFPFQPYAEIRCLLVIKLKRSGFVLERIERVMFAAEQYMVTARTGR